MMMIMMMIMMIIMIMMMIMTMMMIMMMIIGERNINFQRHPAEKTENLGVPYDYESIMHYGKKAFSINGK